MTAAKTQTLTASQKLEALEGKILQTENNIQYLARRLDLAFSQVQRLADNNIILANQQKAIVMAGASGSINEGTVSAILSKMRVEELKAQVDQLIGQGVLVLTEGEVTLNSFLVGRELKDGQVLNERVQVTIQSLNEATKSILLGKKAGDLVIPEGSEITLEITEVYDIVDVSKKMEQEEQKSEESSEVLEENQTNEG